MKFDLYLSEMSVSDQHGGGLTLQRVIGDDLRHIPHFVQTGLFGRDFAPAELFKERSIHYLSPWETDAVRRLTGRTFAAWMQKKPVMVKWHARNVARNMHQLLGAKEPANLLVCPQGPVSVYALEALKRRRALTYTTWIMDDHLVQYRDGRWQYPDGMEQVFAKHLREAQRVFVISPAMQQFYQERFGVHSTVLFGSADLVEGPLIPVAASGESVKIGYFGAVTTWQSDAIRMIGKALNAVNAEIHIYSGINRLPQELDMPGIVLQGKLAPDKVLSIMREYHALLLPISFKSGLRHLSAFNIATKMSECLASGVPLLAVGPDYAAMINYLRKYEAAFLIDTDQPQAISLAFQSLRREADVSVMLKHAKNLVQFETCTRAMHSKWMQADNPTT